jgi:hypothetical protein
MISKSSHKLNKEYGRLVEELLLLVSSLSLDNLTIANISLQPNDACLDSEFPFRLSGILRFTHTALTELRELGDDCRKAESLDELCPPEQFRHILAVIQAWLGKKGLDAELLVYTWNIRHFLKKDTSVTVPAYQLIYSRLTNTEEKCVDDSNPWL